MITFIVYLAVLVIVVSLVWWLLQQLPLPAPFGRIMQIAVVVIAVVILIYLLLGLTGQPMPRLR